MRVDGVWVGWGLGDHSTVDFTVQKAKAYMRAMFRSYAGGLSDTNVYDQQMVDVVTEMQSRLVASGQLSLGEYIPGVLDLPTQYAMGFRQRPAPEKPMIFSVEGHQSNMFYGPVADTATQLETERRAHHQPIGYQNSSIPFDNQNGTNELARLVSLPVMDNGVPFDEDCDWYLEGFSQGMIIVYDFCEQYLSDGAPLAWRRKTLKGILAYGSPTRKLGSVAPWARSWVKNPNTHGLDPLKRFGLEGCFDPDEYGIPMMDVWREGDIFTQNGDDVVSQLKAAVYQAVARGDVLSNPTSIAARLAQAFSLSFDFVIQVVMAIWSGLTFVARGNDNPHYSPFDIRGGIDWMRGLLIQNGS